MLRPAAGQRSDCMCLFSSVRELALFAGAGGGILGGKLLGWRTVCAVEIDAYARSVLLARQGDGWLDKFPIWDDVCTFDGRPWRGRVDVISGGFPCVDVSPAGKREGINGERSGLWWEMLRVVREVLPKHVFVENSAGLLARGMGEVLGGLAESGYDCRWDCIPASAVGAPHLRDRVFIVGRIREAKAMEGAGGVRVLPDSKSNRQRANKDDEDGQAKPQGKPDTFGDHGRAWWVAPEFRGVADGVADRVGDRFKAIGNGQVPPVVRLAWNSLRF